MKVLIYEDEKWQNLLPLCFIKNTFELRCGYYSLFERLEKNIEGEKCLWVRDYIAPLTKVKFNLPVNDENFLKEDLLVINGKALIEEKIDINDEKIFISESGEIIYGLLKKETLEKFWEGDFYKFISKIKENIKSEKSEIKLLEYPWNFIQLNPEVMKSDFEKIEDKKIEGDISEKAEIINEKNVVIRKGAKIHPFSVLDASKGPVFIDEGAEIFPFARIEGPCFIGKETQIMPGASIREGNSFGPVCRIGGEVEESIFHSYSNKYHDGFIGHSYIGEFVNLGGLTINSDLKNDYSNVTVYLNGKPVNTGDLKVGSFIGDHTKTSIGVFFNTGTIAGLMCNITAGGILPKYFPSFTWYINNKFMKGTGFEMAIETAKKVMARRKRELLKEEEDVIRKVYEITEDERKEYIKRSRKKH